MLVNVKVKVASVRAAGAAPAQGVILYGHVPCLACDKTYFHENIRQAAGVTSRLHPR